jgi:hypothetical protein
VWKKLAIWQPIVLVGKSQSCIMFLPQIYLVLVVLFSDVLQIDKTISCRVAQADFSDDYRNWIDRRDAENLINTMLADKTFRPLRPGNPWNLMHFISDKSFEFPGQIADWFVDKKNGREMKKKIKKPVKKLLKWINEL